MTGVGSEREPRSVRFRRAREAEWHALDALTQRALKRGLPSLSIQELGELPVLYRSALSSLAVARRTAMDRQLVAYLESLCARTHVVLYGARPSRRGRMARFLLQDVPLAMRALGGELGLASAIFFAAAALAFVLVSADPSWFYGLMEAGMASGRDPSASTEALRNTLYREEHNGLAQFAAFLFTHNARISMLAFALGFAAGVPTALLLFVNGASIGAFVALFHSRGMLVSVMGWLLPHGVPEISAILLCGAAGFHIGRAVVLPGEDTIARALQGAGRRASVAVLGAVILLAYAGLVEGVFRQTVTADAARFLFAAFNAACLGAWLFAAPHVLGIRSAAQGEGEASP